MFDIGGEVAQTLKRARAQLSQVEVGDLRGKELAVAHKFANEPAALEFLFIARRRRR